VLLPRRARGRCRRWREDGGVVIMRLVVVVMWGVFTRWIVPPESGLWMW
jgi:hypothetical protein